MSQRMPTEKETIVIGGGLAGLSAAAALATRDVPVTLLESRGRLGGRASSFVDQTTGEEIDNCQHVVMGCCTNFHHFCRLTGIAPFFHTERELFFIGPEGTIDTFRAGLLPAPLHLAGSFQKLVYLSREDRRCITRGLKTLIKEDRPDDGQTTFADWLKKQNQTSSAIERFWFVLLVSALSESLDRISVPHARNVLLNGFVANRRAWEVNIPTQPLETIYGDVLFRWFADHDVSIRFNAGVRQIHFEGDAVSQIELRNGERLSAENFVLAVPHHRVAKLLPTSQQDRAEIQAIGQIESAPISSVHLWFDRPITDLPHAVLLERMSQWLFNRSLPDTFRENATGQREQGHYYQVVISASRDLQNLSRNEIVEIVRQELVSVWPEGGQAQLLHHRVVTEHRAVFSVLPGIDNLRPDQQSPWKNLQFAGDWTQTGWPATMEGAVRSGFLAAENILSRSGRSSSILQDDLPVSFLSRLLFGL